MKILFLTHPYPNYVPDLLLHGLRKLLGSDAVEFPRKDCLYTGHLGPGVHMENQLCPGWFPDDEGQIDRVDIGSKIRNGYFDIIVCDLRAWSRLAPNLDGYSGPLAVIDGEDRPQKIPPGPYVIFRRETDGSDFSIPMPMALPEEIFNWIVQYDHLPKQYTIGFLGSTQDDEHRQILDRLIGWYPDSLFEATAIPSCKQPEPPGRKSRDFYYRLLQSCRFVLNLSGDGLDTFRFWENTACNSLHLSQRTPLFIPFDFIDQTHLLRFGNPNELKTKIDSVVQAPDLMKSMIGMSRHHLMNHHLTTHRADYFVRGMAKAYGLTRENLKPVHSLGRNRELNHRNKKKIYLGLSGHRNSGWGVCSHYFKKELSAIADMKTLNEQDDTACALDGILFQGLKGADFIPSFTRAKGFRNIGYAFFERELTTRSKENAACFDLVLAGSNWCRERILEKGIENSGTLLQGIDPDVFYPIKEAKPDDRFVIFSGGKFELRKGQDLVLRALKVFQDKHPDVLLINCWYNIWEHSIRMMESSRHIQFKYHPGQSWKENMKRTYLQNGLDPERIVTFDLVPYEDQRRLYAQTDLGLFPNRCEGGTNLVMMEYMACGKPVIASNTSGQKDILTPENAICLNELHDLNVVDSDGEIICRWQEPCLDELLDRLEYAYQNRAKIAKIGHNAGEALRQFTWRKSAQTLLGFINSLR